MAKKNRNSELESEKGSDLKPVTIKIFNEFSEQFNDYVRSQAENNKLSTFILKNLFDKVTNDNDYNYKMVESMS